MDVIIVDDEPAARRTLRECCAREPDLRIVGEYGDSRTALEAIRGRPPDLLFLDIQMDLLSGIALARSLDPRALPLVVFVTAYDHYALEAFEVSAVDYLLKPFDDERFRRTLERVRRRHAADSGADRQAALSSVLEQLERSARALADARPRVLAESGSRMHMLDPAQVELVEGDRNYVKLTVGRDIFHIRRFHTAIPGLAGINHNVRSRLTRTEAHVRFDLDTFRTLQRLSEFLQQLDSASRLTIGILADQNVRVRHFCQTASTQSFSAPRPIE